MELLQAHKKEELISIGIHQNLFNTCLSLIEQAPQSYLGEEFLGISLDVPGYISGALAWEEGHEESIEEVKSNVVWEVLCQLDSDNISDFEKAVQSLL